MTRMSICTLLISSLFLAPVAMSAERPFLKETSQVDKNDQNLAKALKQTLAFPATVAVSNVYIDGDQIKDNASLTFELSGKTYTTDFVRSEVVTNPDKSPKSYIWYGDIMPRGTVQPAVSNWQDPLNFVTLVKSEDAIVGLIHQESKLFEIRTLKDGTHIAIEMDGAKMPLDEKGQPQAPDVSSASPKSTPNAKAHVEINVMTVVTERAVTGYGNDMVALMQLAVALANQSYINSGIKLALRLAAYQVTSYKPTNFPDLDIRRLLEPNDDYMEDSLLIRDQSRSDVMLLIDDYGPFEEGEYFCGLASQVSSTESTAAAAVNYQCVANLSFAHELGHLQSARHDIETDPSVNPYPFAHGYRYTGTNPGWETLMSYPCNPPLPKCPRLNAWSNPGIRYNGVPMGDPGTADNHRVLELTKEAISNFR